MTGEWETEIARVPPETGWSWWWGLYWANPTTSVLCKYGYARTRRAAARAARAAKSERAA